MYNPGCTYGKCRNSECGCFVPQGYIEQECVSLLDQCFDRIIMDHRTDMVEAIQVSVPFHNTGNICNHSVKQHQFMPLYVVEALFVC